MVSRFTRTKFPQSDITKNIKLIKTIAWSYHVSTSIDYKELISEGCVAYLKAVKRWNPSKAQLSTFMWACISSHLKNFIKKEKKHQHSDEVEYNKGFSESYFFERLSPDSIQIVEMLKRCPNKFISLGKSKSEYRIKSILSKRGWCDSRITEAFINIHEAL